MKSISFIIISGNVEICVAILQEKGANMDILGAKLACIFAVVFVLCFVVVVVIGKKRMKEEK